MGQLVSSGLVLLESFLLIGVAAWALSWILESIGWGEYAKGIRMGGMLFIVLMLLRQVSTVITAVETLAHIK